ncbi:hypothetical protein DHW03_06035 [Pedobacter yonginense]|uniref:Uncharacterized protein n=1 Tax=Pedobacter yonginense TaxID=651869 RepID=A0A317ERQ9_9SPHI|nr:hypothetical protein DHW03_06035 [Pedobacter yonginense]
MIFKRQIMLANIASLLLCPFVSFVVQNKILFAIIILVYDTASSAKTPNFRLIAMTSSNCAQINSHQE